MIGQFLISLLDYPDLEGDEARRGIWLVDVPLAATHHLRNAINTGKAIPKEVLGTYEIPIVASVLKLYLLELPGTDIRFQWRISFANSWQTLLFLPINMKSSKRSTPRTGQKERRNRGLR